MKYLFVLFAIVACYQATACPCGRGYYCIPSPALPPPPPPPPVDYLQPPFLYSQPQQFQQIPEYEQEPPSACQGTMLARISNTLDRMLELQQVIRREQVRGIFEPTIPIDQEFEPVIVGAPIDDPGFGPITGGTIIVNPTRPGIEPITGGSLIVNPARPGFEPITDGTLIVEPYEPYITECGTVDIPEPVVKTEGILHQVDQVLKNEVKKELIAEIENQVEKNATSLSKEVEPIGEEAISAKV